VCRCVCDFTVMAILIGLIFEPVISPNNSMTSHFPLLKVSFHWIGKLLTRFESGVLYPVPRSCYRDSTLWYVATFSTLSARLLALTTSFTAGFCHLLITLCSLKRCGSPSPLLVMGIMWILITAVRISNGFQLSTAHYI